MTTRTRKITVDEFWEMPGEFNHRYELVDGELVEIGRRPRRGTLTGEIGGLILGHVEVARLPLYVGVAVGFQIDTYNLRFPDVSVTTWERMADYDEAQGPWPHFAPDTVVEVTDRNNPLERLAHKTIEYFAGGTQAIWVADPDLRTVTIRRPGVPEQVFSPDDILSGEPEIPGFHCLVADIYAVLDRRATSATDAAQSGRP